MRCVKGFAVVGYGKIDIATVSAHRRGALVNWLVIQRHLLITNATTDPQIEEMWRIHKGRDHVIHEVDITIGPVADKQ